MLAVRTQNLRCLEDSGYLSLERITLLVGHNSTGKSSFLRVLPLLQQSMAQQTSRPILWNGPMISYGSYDSAVRINDEEPAISLGIQNDDLRFELYFHYDHRSETTYIGEIEGGVCDHRFSVGFDLAGAAVSLRVNQNDFSEEIAGDTDLLLELFTLARSGRSRRRFRLSQLEGPFNSFKKYWDAYGKGEMLISSSSERLSVAEIEQELHTLGFAKLAEADLALMIDLYFAAFELPRLMISMNALLDSFSIHYMQPVRAKVERNYRWNGFAVERVQPNGANLAMVLANFSKERLQYFADWTLAYFRFEIEIKRFGANVSIYLREQGAAHSYNLVDTSPGLTQTLPLITQLWILVTNNERAPGPLIYALEQPELHLHPQLQILLTDAMVTAVEVAWANGIQLHLLIETHSEVIINRLGHHVCLGKPEKVTVYHFEKQNATAPCKPRIIPFNAKGNLEWPAKPEPQAPKH